MTSSEPDPSTPTDSASNSSTLPLDKDNTTNVKGELPGTRDRSGDAPAWGQLEKLAFELAESHTISHRPRRRPSLLGRLRQGETWLRRAYQHFVQASEAERAVSFAGEWLLDNFYIVQQAIRQVREDMPESYYRQLPKLGTGSLEAYPRIYAIAQELIRHSEAHLDLDRVERFVHAYQQVTPLTMGELWALPTMLRTGIIECLTGAITQIAGLQASFSEDDSRPVPLSPQLLDETTIANCILSLRSLATQDWKVFFESVSLVDVTLSLDPANVYPHMDFDTRDRYRKIVEKVARATGADEDKVAREAVWLASRAQRRATSAANSPPRATHIGFYLLDAGYAQLETRLDYHPPWHLRFRRCLFNHPSPTYLGSIALLALFLSFAAIWYASIADAKPLQLIGAGFLAFLPATAASISLVNWLVTHMVPPRVLPRLDFQKGIPPECRTMVVVPSLVTSSREIESVFQQLELHFLGNEDPHLSFALLADLGDAAQKHVPGDDELLEQLKTGIQTLNNKYGQEPFYLFYREREWNPGENCWMGWERKRGKLIEFNRLLGTGKSSYCIQIGNPDILPEIKYVITLDADTSLPRDSARRLVATLAHPLNRAEFDPESGATIAGYTVLQPRIEIRPTSVNRSLFTRIFAGDASLDPYTLAVSNVYQDLFGEGSYVGKGIYDVGAFERSLAGRVPDNALLSHDLFEGIHGRAGLVTDIVLFEDFPPYYLVYARRLHRWVRGDWQLLPWLLPKVPHAGKGKIPNRLSFFSRWKIVDNLRRSLLAPSLLVWLIAGWSWLPGSALAWTLAGLASFAMPLITSVITALAQGLRRVPWRATVPSLRIEAGRWLLALVFLLYEALLMLDAIASTLVRLTITRKRLLQWTTAAHAVRLFGQENKLILSWRRVTVALLFVLGLASLAGLGNPAAIPVAAPLLLAWLISPLVAEWVGRPLAQKQDSLSPEQYRQLRQLARRTWLFFEQFVGPGDHWLPPDHFQEEPRGLVAHRTSPTNIGLLLLSTLAAYDLGYIGVMDLLLRLRSTLNGMQELEQHRGHLLNWYETRNLEPLPPRYVSTVDSGNLAACLLTLKQGCLALPGTPVLRWQNWLGLLDALDILAEIIEGIKWSPTPLDTLPGESTDARSFQDRETPGTTTAPLKAHLEQFRQQVLAVQDKPAEWAPLLVSLCKEGWLELDRLLISLVKDESHPLDTATLRRLRVWSERVHKHLLNTKSLLDILLPWFLPLSRPPALFTQAGTDPAIMDAWQALRDLLSITPQLAQVPEVCKAGQAKLSQMQNLLESNSDSMAQTRADQQREAHTWCVDLAESLSSARMIAGGLLIGCQNLSEQAEAFFQAMDFRFLFDSQRQVFHLGYNITAGKLDSNHYDLLASEARIASILAIAKGDVPQSHWLHLARPITGINGMRALLSWNGSMFEYLMPPLLIRRYENTLLDQTHHAVVQRQIEYGRQKNVPWGISEAGYYGFDANMNYQYRGFGVPRLGFKRGLGEDLVISPYASLIALPIRPHAVMQNITRLTQIGMLGLYGFYEAIDYTHSRLSLGQKHGIVQSYMAHHQGMILLALTNYLQDRTMVNRFHADPRVQSIDLLLQEKVPQQAPIEEPHPEELGGLAPVQPRPAAEPWRPRMNAPLPQVHFLSNGRYGLLVTNSGGGFSRWQGIDLTRWRADTTLDNGGTWIYIQDRDSGELWSAALQPTAAVNALESQDILFYAHMAEFRRQDHGISSHMEITVSPNDDVEIRRITLTNQSDRTRRLMLTSYGEVVLAPQAVDQRHPAFNKLFIESEYLPQVNGLLYRRRPRSAEEKPIHLAHLLVLAPADEATGAHESDRARFLGRGGAPRAPSALRPGGSGLSGATGATLDPIMALGQEINLKPHATAKLAYVTLTARSRPEAIALAHRYQAFHVIDRTFDQARSSSELELHQLGLIVPEVERIQQLLSLLLYPHPALRADPATLAANLKGQAGLWPYAISGDYPILLARIGRQEDMALIRELLQAHAYWRNRQLKIDLVILNLQDTSYSQELHNQLFRVTARTGGDIWLNRRGGIFLLRADQMTEADRVLLETAARAVLDGEKGRLAEHLEKLRERPTRLPAFVPTSSPPPDQEHTPPLARPNDLLFNNGLGGFSVDGREYLIYLEGPSALDGGSGQWTPSPWINVIANPEFGFVISETGAGYTWAENSGENRLTPWRNDPVTDEPGEALYLRDEETGHVWSPTPMPAGAPAPCLIRHGAGYSIFEHNSHGLKQQLRLFTVLNAPVKVITLRLENTWNRNRRITATYYAEWVLGTSRDMHQQHIVLEFDATGNALLARNPYNAEFGERVAFLAASKEPHSLTADRTEFLGRQGSIRQPAALGRMGLASAVRAGLDPCAAMQLHVWLAPGETEELFFLLGQGADRQEALGLVRQYQDAARVDAAWRAVNEFWDELLGTTTVRTPDPAMDLLLNRWLLYQALSCRVWGRSALYQSSGAFGYRDQLQDVLGLMLAAPDLARDHILRAARYQFKAGDVLHWWHPPSGRGVRTRCSDDLLWLPFVTAHYLDVTGDISILSEHVPFLEGEPLESEEHDRYDHYEATTKGDTLYEHCRRALDRGLTAGAHGLPLIGSHDWNDGLSRVGIDGQGESVWLGWFLYATLRRFAAVCELVGKAEQAATYRQQAHSLRLALETNAWDGNWYRRAYYDDGAPLGSAESDECRIDSIAQSWAVLSGAADRQRATQAMEAVADQLVRNNDQLILLFTPPFDKTSHDPGYIKGYLPGIRENGGQYTHAALWAVWAFAELGQGDRAEALFRLLNPIYHSDTRDKAERYRVEPYVVAADVYSVPPHTGRGGWTWYTGSASWMHRVGLEAILGLRRVGKALQICPCIPKSWSSYDLTYRDNETVYQIRVENPDRVNQGIKQVTMNGTVLPGGEIPLVNDGRHHQVHVLMG